MKRDKNNDFSARFWPYGTAFLLCILMMAICASFAFAQDSDPDSLEIIDYLLGLSEPLAPAVFKDGVVFSAPNSYRRVGVAFAHENFSQVHWFRKLLVPQDPLGAPIPPKAKFPDPYKDSNILFYVHKIPDGVKDLEYRLVINGLWTVDPTNSLSRKDSSTGIAYSVLEIPQWEKMPNVLQGPPGSLSFSFPGPPGESVTVAGSFNGWDPFMYELKEYPVGIYTLNIPLPPGKYQYIFFHRGERYLDPYNPTRVYSNEGHIVSEVVIQ